jgi:hypothetical protein
LLLYLGHRLNLGVVAAFVPFVINVISVTAFRVDPTGTAI